MKPGNPTKHHYVPRVYLKRFADDNNQFYQLSKQYKGISEKNISQVGYSLDYFKIQREETKVLQRIKDEYHIEKRAFTSQENDLTTLANIISQKLETPFEVSKSLIEAFLATLITIKRRNPKTRKELTDKLREKASSGAFEKLFEPFREFAQMVDNTDPMIYLNKEKNEFINEASKADDLYLSSFIDKSKIVSTVTETFLQSAIQVYHAPDGSQFITSDNPGIFFIENDIINFGGLGERYLFAFPLCPATCLIIDSEESGYESVHHITIIPKACTEVQVNQINSATAQIANSNLFIKDRSYADKFQERLFKDQGGSVIQTVSLDIFFV